MAEYVIDGGFELFPLDGVDGWLASGTPLPFIVASPVQAGAKACSLRWQTVDGAVGGIIQSQPLGAGAIGLSLTTFWARRLGAFHSATILRVIMNRFPDAGLQMDLNFATDLSDTFQQFTFNATPLNATDHLRFVIRNDAPGALGSSVAIVDTVSLKDPETDVAVMLSELGRKALLKSLQDNLASELTDIVTERGDSLALAAPKSWFGYERRPGGKERRDVDGVSVEVYERPGTGVGFPLWPRQVGAFTSGASPPPSLQSSVALEVTLWHANRDGVSGGLMRDRSDRYGAAIMRVIRNDPTLGVSGIIVQMSPDNAILIGPEKAAKDSGVDNPADGDLVRVRLTVDQQETSIGEGVASGGVPPLPPLGTETF